MRTLFNDSHTRCALDAIQKTVATARSSPLSAPSKGKHRIWRDLHNRRGVPRYKEKQQGALFGSKLFGRCLSLSERIRHREGAGL
jgi:hypothetical protein